MKVKDLKAKIEQLDCVRKSLRSLFFLSKGACGSMSPDEAKAWCNELKLNIDEPDLNVPGLFLMAHDTVVARIEELNALIENAEVDIPTETGEHNCSDCANRKERAENPDCFGFCKNCVETGDTLFSRWTPVLTYPSAKANGILLNASTD